MSEELNYSEMLFNRDERLIQEIERLNNIIKEAREYIEENTRIDKINKDKRCFKLPSQAMNILEILDKENN